jgi:hypothetical protein
LWPKIMMALLAGTSWAHQLMVAIFGLEHTFLR